MKLPIVYWGYLKENGKEHGNYYFVYWGYIGIKEKNMERICTSTWDS